MKYTVKTKFVNSGEFKIEAKSESEARQLIEENCTMFGETLNTYPILLENIDWNFPKYLDQHITAVYESEKIESLNQNIKFQEVEQLDSLMDCVSESFDVISNLESKLTSGMGTNKANEHYKENVESYYDTLTECLQKISCLSYELKKELGILNNK